MRVKRVTQTDYLQLGYCQTSYHRLTCLSTLTHTRTLAHSHTRMQMNSRSGGVITLAFNLHALSNQFVVRRSLFANFYSSPRQVGWVSLSRCPTVLSSLRQVRQVHSLSAASRCYYQSDGCDDGGRWAGTAGRRLGALRIGWQRVAWKCCTFA